MSRWDWYKYDNDATERIKMEKEQQKRRQEDYASRLSPLYTGETVDYERQQEMDKELDFNELDIETQYNFNRKQFFSTMKEPDFGKIESVKTKSPGLAVGSLLFSMGARPLAMPMKIYKFKTIDQETGAEVIVPQKAIEVIAENENNYYYLTKNGLETVAKNETAKKPLDEKTLKTRFMQQINKQSQNIAKNMSGSMSAKNVKNSIEGPGDIPLSSFMPTGVMGGGMKESDITLGDVEENAKSFLYGAADVLMTPINWAVDKIVERAASDEGGYKDTNAYFKAVEKALKEKDTSKKTQKALDKMLKEADASKYPKGYSRETDALVEGKTKDAVAKARAKDQESTYKRFIGKNEKEEITTANEVTKVAGELVGTLAELYALSGLAGAVTKGAGLASKAKWIKRGADAIISGGGYGFLEKLKEKDATAMDTFKSAMKEAGFFAVGGEASNLVGKAFGPTRKIGTEILKRGAKATAFGTAGTGVAYPFMEEEEKSTKNLLMRAGTGAAFELGGGLLTKRARRPLTNKIAKKLKSVAEKESVGTTGTKFEKEFELDKSLKGLTKRKKVELANKAQSKIVNEIGENVKAKVGSSSPKKIAEYYKKKYDLKGKIKVTDDLTGTDNIAQIEIKKTNQGSKRIEVRYNKEKSDTEIAASIRHEIEHQIDVGEGYTTTDFVEPPKKAKTLREFMAKEGHHKKYKNFEIEYLENIYETELAAGKTIGEIKDLPALKSELTQITKQKASVEKQLSAKKISKQKRSILTKQLEIIKQREETYRSGMRLFSENKPFRNETLHATNREITGASNLPTYIPAEKSLKTKAKNLAESIYTGVFNRQHAIDKTGKMVKITSQNYSAYHGTVEYINTENLASRHGNKIGNKSLKDVAIAPKGLQAEYESYLYHKAHIERMKQGKPIVANAQGKPMKRDEAKKIVAEYEKRFPEFKKASQDLYQFLDDFMREWAVDGGLVTPEEYAKLRNLYPSYVPAFRSLEEFASLDAPRNVMSNRVIKAAVGGTEPLTPLSESLPVYVQQVVRAQRRNLIHTELLNAVIKNPEEMQKYAEVYQPKRMRKEITKRLKDFGGEKNEVEDTINKMSKLLIDDAPTKGRFAIVLAEGQPITMKINDKDLWKALTELQNAGTSQHELVKVFNKYVTNSFKGVVTRYNPFFALRNVARDIPTAYIQGSVHRPDKFIYNMGKSFVTVAHEAGLNIFGMKGNSKLYGKYRAIGGSTENLTKIEKSLKDKGMVRKSIDKLFEFVNLLGHISETMPRYAEFEAVYKSGMKKGLPEHQVLQEALHASKEITVNFSRGGKVGKGADIVMPYVNAGLQGVDKFTRSLITEGIMTGNFAPLLKGLGLVTGATAVSHILMKNFAPDSYKDLPDWVVDNYYVFPVGDTKYIRIPKSRESGLLFSTLFQRTVRALDGDKDAFKNIDISSSIFNPLKELGSGGIAGPALNITLGGNKDYFGRDIEPLSAKFEKTSKRYIVKETTSKASKAFAPLLEKIGISPAQSDYLIDSYMGIIGDMILGFNDVENGTTLEKMSGMTVDTKYSSKSKSAEYEEKDKASRELADFEHMTGLTELKKKLTEEGVTGWRREDAINEKLSWAEREKYQELKDKKKEVNKEDEQK